MNKDVTIKVAKDLRKLILKGAVSTPSRGAHLGGSLSCIDILSVLFGLWSFDNQINNSSARLTFSKGHSCLALYSFLLYVGLLSEDDFDNFQSNGSNLMGHPVRDLDNGIYFSSGSLGIGLANCVGQAIYMKKKYNLDSPKIICIVGDGEASEGIVYESLAVASKHLLSNLLIIIDVNGLQQTGFTKDISNTINWSQFAHSLGCIFYEIADGNNHEQIIKELTNIKESVHHTVQVVAAKTVKGSGISFMENDNKWHYASLSKEKYIEAIKLLNL
tara:strand:+ start:212 stop:1033 length:822 start_codon:yes stop_codon:yes gene_type:complete